MIDAERTESSVLSRTEAGVLAPVFGTFQAVAAFSKRKPLGAAGGAITLALIAVAALAPIIAPHDPRELMGVVHAPPQLAFPLGTDAVGRDMLSRMI